MLQAFFCLYSFSIFSSFAEIAVDPLADDRLSGLDIRRRLIEQHHIVHPYPRRRALGAPMVPARRYRSARISPPPDRSPCNRIWQHTYGIEPGERCHREVDARTGDRLAGDMPAFGCGNKNHIRHEIAIDNRIDNPDSLTIGGLSRCTIKPLRRPVLRMTTSPCALRLMIFMATIKAEVVCALLFVTSVLNSIVSPVFTAWSSMLIEICSPLCASCARRQRRRCRRASQM